MLVHFRLLFQYHEITDVSYKGIFVAHYKNLLLPKSAIFRVVYMMHWEHKILPERPNLPFSVLIFISYHSKQNMDDTTS